ncbi:CPBP family intramembrane glutamic endopeptidase [Mucilaginibacter sp. AW1-3]
MKEKQVGTLHPSVQFLMLAGIFVAFFVAGGALGFGIVYLAYGSKTIGHITTFNTAYPGVINGIWILQLTSTTIPLFLAPVIFAKYIVTEPGDYLKAAFPSKPVLFLMVLAVMFISSPVMELLVNLNQQMKFPHFLQGLYDWMRHSEDQALKETQLLLKMNSIGAMLFDLLVIGLLTAIAEEFLFRGCVQTIFTRWTKSQHWGVWIAAALFSAFHLQFFGFFPRLMLGVFFGYFVTWSGSIWPAVWAHFINNGSAVIVTYLFQQKLIKLNPDDQHVFNYFGYIFSLVLTVFLLIVYRNIAQSKKALPV